MSVAPAGGTEVVVLAMGIIDSIGVAGARAPRLLKPFAGGSAAPPREVRSVNVRGGLPHAV